MTVIEALGGLGIFLLGMIIMTEGLRSIAGDSMRLALTKFTSTPFSAMLTGTISTAILQSSSATTVAAVGFVGVGILTFTQAVGIILGANLGTTITGWLVALLGFKLKLKLLVLPLILVGAILRLFSEGRVAHIGYAMAGFAVIFVGIAMMQEGMGGLQGILTPDVFPPNTIIGRIQLVIIGAMITVVTQSSSAGVAATLTALNMGNILLPQGMSLIIGMDIGTTVTAVLATIGADVGAKRTGMSHVMYNLISGTIGFILLSPFLYLWHLLLPDQLDRNAEIILVAFHSCFNIIAIMVMLPFIKDFAHFIEKIIPEKKIGYTSRLDHALLDDPKIAIMVIDFTIEKQLIDLLIYLNRLLGAKTVDKRINLGELQIALDETHRFIDHIHLESSDSQNWKNLVALIHILDHMQRLHERCDEEQDRAMTTINTPELIGLVVELRNAIDLILKDMYLSLGWLDSPQIVKQVSEQIHEQVEPYRQMVMTKIAQGKQDIPSATSCLEAIRWLERVSDHLEHLVWHFQTLKI